MSTVRFGLRANARQFSLLVAITALVGSTAGLERSVLPLVGEEDFGITSRVALLGFIAAFGAAKAIGNLLSGSIAERSTRKHVLVAGWLIVLPVGPVVALAPSWGVIVGANLLLGAGQGLAWSMTIVMKIDLVGQRRRGLALGLNESAGYVGVAIAAFATGAAASAVSPRTAVWVGMLAVSVLGLVLSVVPVRDTSDHVSKEQTAHGGVSSSSLRRAVRVSVSEPVLRACSQAGFVNNLNDAVMWGVVPLYLAAHGADTTQIGLAAGLYPAVWGFSQIATGWLSDTIGRKRPIAAGMLVQAVGLVVLVAGGGTLGTALVAAALLGLGTALAYPTLMAAVSDVVAPRERAPAIGVYRFWRDSGFVVGAILAGLVADASGLGAAVAVTAVLTALSGVWVALVRFQPAPLAAGGGASELG